MSWLDWLRKRPTPEPATSNDERIVRAPTDEELDHDIDDFVSRGQEQAAIEALRNVVVARGIADPARMLHLAELLCGRLEHATARPFLEQLTRAPAQRERALLLLAEQAERAGELERARATWERLLAYDVDQARARSAVERLRPARQAGTLPDVAPAALGRRYKLLGELGRGASGTVYRAEDSMVQREVALKILHPSARGAGGTTAARLRAWQEARISATLRHPGAAAIFDLDEERQLISMELCQGGSLRERLIAGPLRLADALRALAQLVDVLAAAHAIGIVHGDVKPANLLLRQTAETILDDDLVLCDFGVARLSDDTAPAIEQRATRGTLVYMAPEQRLGTLAPAADVYAAGVVAIELLGGHDALGAAVGDRAALLRGDLSHDATLPGPVATALGARAPALQALLTALLARDPAQRPTAADAAARALGLVL
ncbi:MAG: serine/threonine-protein kinase [Polyangia bacterium]